MVRASAFLSDPYPVAEIDQASLSRLVTSISQNTCNENNLFEMCGEHDKPVPE